MDDMNPHERLARAPRTAGAAVEEHGVPSDPGAYCWWQQGQPLFVGWAEDLRRQLTKLDTRSGNRPVPEFRQLVRGRLELLGSLPRGADRQQRVTAIDEYVATCDVSWLVTDSAEEARQLAAQAAAELVEADSWHARPGEDRWLRRYLDGLDDTGRVYVEVPIGGGEGAKTRRIDAVRFPRLANGVRYFNRASFTHDLQADALDIIEVKRTLNRTVIGQLIVARELATSEWNRAPSQHVGLVAVVTETDTALEPICKRHGIRVEVVERHTADAPELADDR